VIQILTTTTLLEKIEETHSNLQILYFRELQIRDRPIYQPNIIIGQYLTFLIFYLL